MMWHAPPARKQVSSGLVLPLAVMAHVQLMVLLSLQTSTATVAATFSTDEYGYAGTWNQGTTLG